MPGHASRIHVGELRFDAPWNCQRCTTACDRPLAQSERADRGGRGDSAIITVECAGGGTLAVRPGSWVRRGAGCARSWAMRPELGRRAWNRQPRCFGWDREAGRKRAPARSGRVELGRDVSRGTAAVVQGRRPRFGRSGHCRTSLMFHVEPASDARQLPPCRRDLRCPSGRPDRGRPCARRPQGPDTPTELRSPEAPSGVQAWSPPPMSDYGMGDLRRADLAEVNEGDLDRPSGPEAWRAGCVITWNQRGIPTTASAPTPRRPGVHRDVSRGTRT